jgi:hypothetical protein
VYYSLIIVMTKSSAQMVLDRSLLNNYSDASNWMINHPGICSWLYFFY